MAPFLLDVPSSTIFPGTQVDLALFRRVVPAHPDVPCSASPVSRALLPPSHPKLAPRAPALSRPPYLKANGRLDLGFTCFSLFCRGAQRRRFFFCFFLGSTFRPGKPRKFLGSGRSACREVELRLFFFSARLEFRTVFSRIVFRQRITRGRRSKRPRAGEISRGLARMAKLLPFGEEYFIISPVGFKLKGIDFTTGIMFISSSIWNTSGI